MEYFQFFFNQMVAICLGLNGLRGYKMGLDPSILHLQVSGNQNLNSDHRAGTPFTNMAMV